MAFGTGAYLVWGVFPLYFLLLVPAGAFEVLVHRILWTLAFCTLLLTVTRTWRDLVPLLREPRRLLLLGAAAVVIAVNWVVYIYGVTTERVVEASLGYFINPLVTVLLGVMVLRERLRPLQWAALGIGAAAVAGLTVDYGRLPWISVVLAVSFGSYGLLKNRVGRGTGALASLTAETALLAPLALVALAWLTASGRSTFTLDPPGHGLLLASTGVATALPLLMFAAAARRIPLSTVGLLQYLTPVLQFLCGVVLLGERMPPSRWVGFAAVWLALVVLSVDAVRAARGRARQARSATAPAAVPA
jgi:chloramphenicol-sensitive protein RarD